MARSNENSVGASVGITKNLGNYESLRLDAWATRSVNDPSDEAEVEAAWNAVWSEVQEQIEAQLLDAEKGLD